MSHTVPEQRSDAGRLCTLGPGDLGRLRSLMDRDPALHVFARHRVDQTGLHEVLMGGRFYGWYVGTELVSACHAGANVVPVEATPEAIEAFAGQLLIDGHRAASVVGPRDQATALWELVRPSWGPARSERPDQPFLVLDGPASVPPDPRVRRVVMDEFDLLYPASVAMFREEVGVDPEVGGASGYRARVAQLIGWGWSFAIVEDGRVLFKAEVGAATSHACQVQGVWVAPELRGTGIAAAAMAAVVEQVRDTVAPVVTLYVNAHNVPARRLYDRVGFEQVATFASYLL